MLYSQLLELKTALVFISGVESAYSAPLSYNIISFLANLKVNALGAPYIV